MNTTYKCRLCLADSLDLAFDFGNQPIVHQLLINQDDSYSTFPFRLAYCNQCGFLQMVDYIKPQNLYKNYFTLSKWKAQPHALPFLANMVKIFGLESCSRIFEVGCNDGLFLSLLIEKGFNNVCGVEPTEDSYQIALEKNLPVLMGFYGVENADNIIKDFPNPDLIVSRQVIEHIPDLHGFLETIKRHLKPGGGLALEFPDHSMNYEELDYTFWEEHVNYFTLTTIRNLLAQHGFEVIHYESTLFSGKCLFVYAVNTSLSAHNNPNYHSDAEPVERYIGIFSKFKSQLHNFLDQHINLSGKAVLFGCGARSCNAVNLLDLGDYFEMFVDDRKEKQNKFVPGCCLPIKSSSQLNSSHLVALGVNCENESYVIKTNQLQHSFSILPPSRLLPNFWKKIKQSSL